MCFGQRGAGEYGLFISKPGHDVMTASDANLLFSSLANWEMVQVVQTGYVSMAGTPPVTKQISWTPLGFRPIVLLKVTGYFIWTRYDSDNTMTLYRETNSQVSGSPFVSTDVYYSVLSVSY